MREKNFNTFSLFPEIMIITTVVRITTLLIAVLLSLLLNNNESIFYQRFISNKSLYSREETNY